MKFNSSGSGVNRNVVDNDLIYVNMHFQQNRQHTFQGNDENRQKSSKMPFLTILTQF